MNCSRTLSILAAAGAVLLAAPGAQAAPANDNLANAQPVTAGTTVPGTNAGATVEPGERLWGWNLSKSVWYSFTAPKDGQVKFDACDKDFSLNMDMWTGTDPARTSYIYTGSGACGATHAFTQWMNVEGGKTYLLQITGVGGGRNEGTFNLTTSFDGTKDTNPPQIQVIWGPGPDGPTALARPRWEFASSESDTAYECAVDSDAFVACDKSWTATRDLADGAHTLHVKGTDKAGNPSAVVDRAFTVDRTPPVTVIRTGPTGDTTETTPQFTFRNAGFEAATYTCAVDGGRPVPCTSPWRTPTLALGAHAVTVRAQDALGNEEGAGATRSFRVVEPATDTPAASGSTSSSSAPAPGATAGSTVATLPAVKAKLRIVSSRRSARRRTQTVVVRCTGPAGTTCTAKLRVQAKVASWWRARTRTVKTVAVRLAAGRSQSVTVKLPRSARKVTAALR